MPAHPDHRFSIILPVHNGGAYLAEALASVFAQTYPHFELVVLENASTDETPQTLQAVADPRITVIPSDTLLPIGENWARATAIDLAPFVLFLSHDDRLGPDYLSAIVRLMDAYPDANVYTTHFNLIDAQGQILRPSKATPLIETAGEYLLATHTHKRDSFGTGYVMRSDRFLAVGGIPQLRNLMFADDLLVYSAIQDGVKVCDPSARFDYRYHAVSTARLTTLETTYDAGVAYLAYLEKHGFMDTPGHRASAEGYVHSILVRRHRALLLSLMNAGDNQRREYAAQMARLRAHADWQGDSDWIVRLFRRLLNLPPLLRRMVYVFGRTIARITWQIRNRY
jgi:glycosyltransferase involved in cell wall biosynthesis